MSKKQIVFVLGAGASIPYGYPSGPQLLKYICEIQKIDGLLDHLHQLGYGSGLLEYFQRELENSQWPSIDAFLEHREDFREIGKAAISAIMLSRECQGTLKPGSDHWCPLLLNLVEGKFDELDYSNIKIVTFNYDRSLEQFLFTALKARYDKPADDVTKLIQSMDFVHLYGSVGPLEWQDKDGRPYCREIMTNDIYNAARSIEVMPEGRDDSPTFQTARRWIAEADRVIFLGMAYHRINMKRLGFPLISPKPGSVIFGTAYELTAAEQDYIENKSGINKFGDRSHTSLTFLRESRDFQQLREW